VNGEQDKGPCTEYTPPRLRLLGDVELVAALQDGCNDALAVLFERYSPLVFHIARSIIRDDGEAEEAVQQVFFDLFRAIAQFRAEKGSFKSWLLQFAYHRSINRREHLSAKRFYQREALDESLSAFESVQAFSGRQFFSPEVSHLIKQVLRTLCPEQRQVIELTYFDGLTAEEIARKLGETASAVRHHLYRGLSHLRDALLEGDGEGEKTTSRRANDDKGILVAQPRIL
jgi:RNA polymerase sigma-70 factor, ECF subfamily